MKQQIPLELPLVNKLVGTYGDSRIFSGVNLIFAQHLVGDFIPFLRVVMRMGAQPELCWFLDIPYAANKVVRDAIIKLGFLESHFAQEAALGALDPYASTQYFRTINLFKKAITTGIKQGVSKTIIIDDGGHAALARYIINELLSSNRHSIHVVEQTGHGIKLDRRFGIMEQFPVVNIAESATKLSLETPVIARSALARLTLTLRKERIIITSKDRVLVMGYGNVGTAITRALISEWGIQPRQITIKPDPLEEFCKLDEQGNLSPIAHGNLVGSHRLVLGCSGVCAFHHSHLPLLTKTSLLASVSSWSLEFPKDDWVAASQSPREHNVKLLNKDMKTLSVDVHQPLYFSLNGQIVILANAGYPINFWGGINTSPPELMQLTVAMMLAGAIQAATTNADAGEQELDPSVEKWVVTAYNTAQNEPVSY